MPIQWALAHVCLSGNYIPSDRPWKFPIQSPCAGCVRLAAATLSSVVDAGLRPIASGDVESGILYAAPKPVPAPGEVDGKAENGSGCGARPAPCAWACGCGCGLLKSISGWRIELERKALNGTSAYGLRTSPDGLTMSRRPAP